MRNRLFSVLVLIGLLVTTLGHISVAEAQRDPNDPCPGGTGPGGIVAGDYPPQDLTQEQRQWLWNVFGNNPNETAPVGYGGERCGGNVDTDSGRSFIDMICEQNSDARYGPRSIRIGAYAPQDLTQNERQWLWNMFHPNENPHSAASQGYGGERCPWQSDNYPAPTDPNASQPEDTDRIHTICNQYRNEHGPGGIQIGSYNPQDLTQEQRQWLWDRFNPNERGQTAPIGYGGSGCPWQSGNYAAPQPDSSSAPSSPGNNVPFSPSTTVPIGFSDFSFYCGVLGHGGAQQVGTDFYCVMNGGGLQAIDVPQACDWIKGEQYLYAGYDDGWYCSTTPATVNRPAPQVDAAPAYVEPDSSHPAPSEPTTDLNRSYASDCELAGPVQVSRGDRVRVINTGDHLNVRPSADTQRDPIPGDTLSDGDEVILLDGPSCADGYRWWQIGPGRYIADGVADSPWLETVNSAQVNPGDYDLEPAPDAGASAQIEGEHSYVRCENVLWPDDGCITGADPEDANVIFVNGIDTSGPVHNGGRTAVADVIGGTVMGIYNRGISANGIFFVSEAEAYATLVRYLRDYPDRDITLVGHSQGGMIIAEALQTIVSENLGTLGHITLYTFGSPATNYPRTRSALHVTFWNDRIATVPRAMGLDGLCVIPAGAANLPSYSREDLLAFAAGQHSFRHYIYTFSDYCN